MPDRLFRALLRLLPEELRAGYAREMEATFRAERREAGATGRVAPVLRLWLATLGDLLKTVPGEHLDVLARDVRYGLRTMAARPGHTLAAVATLALAIGANVAMFAVVDAVLLAPLPYRDPGSLVLVAETEHGGDPGNVGYLSFVDLQARARSLGGLAAASQAGATLTGGGLDAERVNAMRVSRSYFDLIGVRPALGRAFTEEEDRPGPARRVAILSDRLWRRRFGADPAVIGRLFELSGTAFTVVGVMPADFEDLVAARLFEGSLLWLPLGYDPAASFACRTCRHLRVFGRLSPGVSPRAAERELGSIFAALERDHPKEYSGAGARVSRLSDVLLGPVRPVLLLLWGGVTLLLLVACGNVGSLLLLRASERSHEIAVRAALGVTRGRLTRQLLTESALLAFLGGTLGLLPAAVAVRLLAWAGPSDLPRLTAVSFDVRAAAFTLVLVALSGMLFGMAPLRQLLAGRSGDALQGPRRTDSAGAWRMRSGLVAVNMAMAVLLLVGSGLLVRSLQSLLAVSPGLDPRGVLTLQVTASGERFSTGDEDQQVGTAVRFFEEVLSRVRALPGVGGAAAVTTLPFGGNNDGYGLHIQDRPLPNPEEAPDADRFVVTPGYFETLRIPLVRGRLLDARDRQGGDPVAVINRSAAEALFPDEDPFAHRIALGGTDAPFRTIVGVVGDVRHHGLHATVGPQVYVPQAQWMWAETSLTLVVRSHAEAAALAAPVREIVRAIDPAQPVTDVRLYEDVVAASLGPRRFASGLLTAFAAIALVLAVVGLYGALGFVVGRRRREIGVRLAMGAEPAAIQRMVLVQGLGPATVGLGGGLAVAALSAGLLRSMLYETRPLDPTTFAAVALLLLACALAACVLPAWRASRIDPARVLRAD